MLRLVLHYWDACDVLFSTEASSTPTCAIRLFIIFVVLNGNTCCRREINDKINFQRALFKGYDS